MQANVKDLEKSQVEISVELTPEEFQPYIEKGAVKVSEQVKIEGFRPGKVPFEVLKQKVGEMSILEEAAHIVVRKNIDKLFEDNLGEREPIGQPSVEITKLAPGSPLEFKIKIAILPEVKLGKYKDLGIKATEAIVDEKEAEKTIENLRETRAKEALVDRASVTGDKVLARVELFLDKVPVEDGQIPEAAIILGKEYFVPGFDKNLEGLKAGEEKEFIVAYPAEHFQKNLAGKNVEFKVRIKSVFSRELPEVDDEFSKAYGFKTAADMREFLLSGLKKQAEEKAGQKTEIEILEKILDDSKFGDLPEVLIDNEARVMMSEMEHSIASQGGNFDDYLSSIKKTKNELVMDMLPNAVRRVKSALMVKEIAKVEKLVLEASEVDKKIEDLKVQYAHDEKVQKSIKEPGYRQYLSNILINQKIIKQLKEWNIA
jgi:trigger factor